MVQQVEHLCPPQKRPQEIYAVFFDHIADIAGDCTGSIHVLGKAAGAEKG